MSRLQRSLLSLLLLIPTFTFAQTISPDFVSGLKWRLIGPFRGGRVVAVAGVPGQPATFYFGSVNGGIWKTTDAGVVWKPIFDGQSVGSIGAIAVAASDPNILYAGTGESDIRSDLSSGNGVYKSTDAGQTWTHIGLEDTRQISRIVIDPRDPNVVYVGALGHAYGPNAERGAYKSVDGGAHWAKVLDQGSDIGVSDLTICSGNPDLLFAGTWHTKRPPWSTYGPIDGPGGGLYRSEDAGKTWTRVADSGLPAGDWGRIGVAVAPDGHRVYALIEAKKSGLYRSDDGGTTWALANADPRLTSRAWYFNSITIDPQNPEVVYVPNVALYRSEDGGKTISIVRGAPGGDDYHQIWVDPKNDASMVLGTDQGTTISLDRGKTWSTWYNQPTAQLYHVITDNQFPYVVYGAQQDSGSAAVISRTNHGQITPRDWFPSGPSESGYIALDPDDPSIVYLSGTYGTVSRFNRRTGLSQDITPWPVPIFGTDINQRKYRAPWTPVLVSSSDYKTLYYGSQYVMKTTDGGLHWEIISPDLTGAVKSAAKPEGPPTVQNAKERGYGVVSSIALSSLNRELIWAGTDTGLIHITRDGGKSWKNVTPPELTEWSRISLIEASHFDPGVAYLAVERSRLDDQTPYLYRTRDYGSTWKVVVQGIPSSAFLRAVREDPRSKGLLYAGTELGVYVSFNDGDLWQPLQLNLPVTSIRDLAIHDDDLVVATHGRSFWILDNITPIRQAREVARSGNAWLFRPETAVRIDNDTFVGTPLPPEEPTAENPPTGAMIDYYLRSPAKSVILEVFDPQQHLARRFSSEDQVTSKQQALPIAERWLPRPLVLAKTPGMHRFVWNLAWGDSSGVLLDDDGDPRSPSGPKTVPGAYRVRLTVDGEVHSQSLQVIMDPRSSATLEVLKQQFQLGQQIFSETVEARRAMSEISAAQKQLASAQHGTAAHDAQVSALLTKAQSELGSMLARTESDPKQGRGLQDAYKDMASALRVVEGSDRTVPSQAVLVYKQASEEVKARLKEWAAFKQTQLPQLNQQLRGANLAPIDLRDLPEESSF